MWKMDRIKGRDEKTVKNEEWRIKSECENGFEQMFEKGWECVIIKANILFSMPKKDKIYIEKERT